MSRLKEATAAVLCLVWGFVMVSFFPQEHGSTAVSPQISRAAVTVPAAAAESAIAMADDAPEKV